MNSTALLSHGYFWAFATVFLGGFLTSLTPCVYPLIPITVSLFGGRGKDVKRSRAMALAALYVAGIGTMYTCLGVSSALAGRAFGTFMASPLIMVPIAGLFLVMAASMFGAFELNLPSSVQTKLSAMGGKGFGGAFTMGLVGGIIAAPCTGPVLASVLAFVATTRSVALGGTLLFTYAAGMGVLFFAIAAFAIALPKSGAWMDTVKSVFGIVMVIAALYFLRNVVRPLREYGSASQLWLITNLAIAAVGIALGGVHLSFHASAAQRVRKALGVMAIVAGTFGSIGWIMTPKIAEAAGTKLEWVHGDKVGVAQALAEHKPALLDFYADWCLPCKELELKTFSNSGVASELQRFKLVKVDCTTDDDDAVIASKKRFGAETLPTLVLLGPDGKIRQKIDHFVEPEELLGALKQIH